MTIHVLVEGPSERVLLDRWTPRLLLSVDVRVHPHQGKGSLPKSVQAAPDLRLRGLLDQLPAKLRAFSETPDVDAVIVLIDADDDDPDQLKEEIKDLVPLCAPNLAVEVSVAVEETEAFYLGDLRAIRLAFPNADLDLARQYVPDSICGTWELFGRVIDDDAGNKVAWAEAIGAHLTTNPARSRSPSFRGTIAAFRAVALPRLVKPKAKRFRHVSRSIKHVKGSV